MVWWGVSFGVWLISLSALSDQELLVAALASLPCGFAAYGVRRVVGDSWRFRGSWYSALPFLPVSMFSDAAQVLTASVTGRRGTFRQVSTGFVGPSGEAKTRRALAILIVSTTPGSYVLDIDPDSGQMLVHTLAPRGPDLAERAAR